MGCVNPLVGNSEKIKTKGILGKLSEYMQILMLFWQNFWHFSNSGWEPGETTRVKSLDVHVWGPEFKFPAPMKISVSFPPGIGRMEAGGWVGLDDCQPDSVNEAECDRGHPCVVPACTYVLMYPQHTCTSHTSHKQHTHTHTHLGWSVYILDTFRLDEVKELGNKNSEGPWICGVCTPHTELYPWPCSSCFRPS